MQQSLFSIADYNRNISVTEMGQMVKDVGMQEQGMITYYCLEWDRILQKQVGMTSILPRSLVGTFTFLMV